MRLSRATTSMLHESRAVLEPFRLAAKSPHLVRRAQRSASVIVLPGLGGSDTSTLPLRWYLQSIGHNVQGWELGVHGTRFADTLARFTARLQAAACAADREFALVGWSLGGVIAREVARNRPDLVEQVVTLGSPIGVTRSRRPLRVPITTIFSRNDSVVDWTDAVDRHSPTVTNAEVNSSHLGLGIDPDVWRIVADALDAPAASTP